MEKELEEEEAAAQRAEGHRGAGLHPPQPAGKHSAGGHPNTNTLVYFRFLKVL